MTPFILPHFHSQKVLSILLNMETVYSIVSQNKIIDIIMVDCSDDDRIDGCNL